MKNTCGTFHLLHGLPGSGKSTYAAELRRRKHAIVLNNDDWVVRLVGPNPTPEAFASARGQVRSLQWELATQLLTRGIDVIWDYGVWSSRERKAIKRNLAPFHCPIIVHSMVCGHETAARRAVERSRRAPYASLKIDTDMMRRFRREFEDIVEQEGFDVVRVMTGD